MSEAMEGYQEDLAYIHDVGFTGFFAEAAPGLLGLLRRSGIARGLVVDLGCGSGVWARELSLAGYDVLGIDISPAMIRLARKKAPKARFRTASLVSAKLPRCDAVTSIGECFNYCFDRKSGKKELARFFHRAYDALRSGGVLIFDIAEPGQVSGRMPRTRHSQGKDWAVFVQVDEDKKRKVLTRRITSYRKIGKLYRRSEEVHRLRLYKSSELAAELRRIGFRVKILRRYGKFRLLPVRAGLLAWKPMRSA